MIQLHPDCLVFQTSTGEAIPCSAELVTVELMGDSASQINPMVVQEAASAVVYYFKNELGRTTVSIDEFASALERVLNGLGFQVSTTTEERAEPADLQNLLADSEAQLELLFYTRLRETFHEQLKSGADVLHFSGLRKTVKRLASAKRWCPRCEPVSDQIVDYLRACLSAEAGNASGLVVR